MSGHPTNPTDMWINGVAESAELPTRLTFANSSLGCEDFPVTFVIADYKGFGKLAPLRRNPE